MPTKRWFLLFLAASITFLVYSPSLQNQFIWDDLHLIANDIHVKSFKYFLTVFNTHLFQDIGGSNFYRPLQMISFMLDYSVWKLNPFGYHFTNLFFHILNVILTYFLVSRIFKNSNIGLLAGLIFAIHPVNTEAVTYISGRADPLSAFFFLSALLSYIKFREKRVRPWLFVLSLACFILALLVKESVIVFILAVILYDSFVSGQRVVNLRTMKAYTPYLLISVFYIFLRVFLLGIPFKLLERLPLKIYLLTMSKVLVSYLGLLFFPLNLHMERIELLVDSVFSFQIIFSLIVLACLALFFAIAYKKNKRLFFCGAFSLITLFPMLNILTINALIAEHWLYLPSIGFCAIAAFLFNKAVDLKKPFFKQSAVKQIIILGLICFLAFFAIRTVLRNVEWGRPVEFYKNMIKLSPYSARGHLNLGSLYISAKNYRLARPEFEEAFKLNPMDPLYYQGMGYLDYVEKKDKKSALKNWKKALEISPLYRPVHEYMNRFLFIESHRFRKLVKVASERPKSAIANYRLSVIYLRHNLYVEALNRLERVLAIDPDYANAIFNKAWVHSKLGLYEMAIEEYGKAKRLTPDDPDIYRNLCYCYVQLKQYKKARLIMQEANGLKKP